MNSKWVRFIEVSAQAVILVSVWRGASAMVTSTIGEKLSVFHSLEVFAVPASLIVAVISLAATHLWLKDRRKLRKIINHDDSTTGENIAALPNNDWREQVISDLRNQVVALNEERQRLQLLLQQNNLLLQKDPLTGVFNRLAYNEQLEQEFQRWQRFGTDLAFIIWDVDFFKQINDKHGHAVGDTVLRNIAAHLAARLRSTDFVARYGGEEFVMLLPGADTEHAGQLAETIRQHIAETPIVVGDSVLHVTISCGITSFSAEDTPHTVFQRADQALYQAKHDGRNRCAIAD